MPKERVRTAANLKEVYNPIHTYEKRYDVHPVEERVPFR